MSELTALADPERVHGSIQSLTRAFKLLELIASSEEGLGLAQISREIGMNNSTVFHLLKTMVGTGYLRQDADSKRYFIGGAFFCLAAAARTQSQLVSVAEPLLRDLASATGNTCLLGLRSNHQMFVVAKAEGNGAFAISDRVGGGRPSHCTGMGKIMLSSMAPSELERYLSTYELKALTPSTITTVSRLLAELEEVRRTNLAIDDAEFHPELRCVATPVRDFSGHVVGALAMSCPAWRMSMQGLEAQAPSLLETARRISAQVGGAPKADSYLALSVKKRELFQGTAA
jgi:IclR family transcriptional regulator, KDG regulon repressor